MVVTKGANGTMQVHDPKTGRIVTNVPAGQPKTPAHAHKKPFLAGQTPTGEGKTLSVDDVFVQLAGHTTDAAKGEDAPDLSVSVDDGKTRLYVADPADKQWVMENPDEALKQKRAFPSITTVQKMMPDLSGGLENYSKRMVAKAATDELRDIERLWDTEGAEVARERLGQLLEKSEYSMPVLMAKTMGADGKDLARASERGTKVHAIIERLGRGEPAGDVPVHLTGYIRAFERFRAQFPDLDIAYTEVTVINEKDGYMGTADIILKDSHGKFFAADYKTNKDGRIYDKVGTQLAAVACATHIVHPDGSKEPLPPIVGGIGVGLSPNGECQVVAFPTKPYYKKFVLAAKLWHTARTADAEKKNPSSKRTSRAVHSQSNLDDMFG